MTEGAINISNYLPHLELRKPSIQSVVIMNFVVISNVGIERLDCIQLNICRIYHLSFTNLEPFCCLWPLPLLRFICMFFYLLKSECIL